MFGGLLEKGRKLQLSDINLAVILVARYDRHAFSTVGAILVDLILAV